MKTQHTSFKLSRAAVVLAAAFAVQAQAQSLTEVVQNALVVYPSGLAAKAKTEAQRADIDRARGAHYPQISYGFTHSQYNTYDLPSSMKSNMNSPSVKLNLWSGGRIEADARRAKHLTGAAEAAEASTRDDVALAATEAYIGWARALELNDLAVKNLESHRITLDDIQKIVTVDSGRRIDLEQAQVRLDNAVLAKLQRETELGQARQKLSRFWLSTLPTAPKGVDVVSSRYGPLGQVPRTMDDAMSVVDDNMPAVAQAAAQVRAAQASVDMARGQHWPTVDFTASRQLTPVTTGATYTYKEDTLKQVTVNMPLYNGGAVNAQVDTALAQLKAAQYALDEARMLAKEKVSFAFQDWSNAQGRAKQGAEQARVGDKVVEGYRAQFRLARRQLLDLLNIQAETFNYQSSATQAYYDEQIARARLLASLGDLANKFTPSQK